MLSNVKYLMLFVVELTDSGDKPKAVAVSVSTTAFDAS